MIPGQGETRKDTRTRNDKEKYQFFVAIKFDFYLA